MRTHDTILVHPLQAFRLLVVTSASAIVIVHNHPSEDNTSSEGDVKVTRDLMRAGQLLKIEVLDHIVMGTPNHISLRELGYFLRVYPPLGRAFFCSWAGTHTN